MAMRINPPDLSDPLTFPVMPPAGQCFYIYGSQMLYPFDFLIIPWHFCFGVKYLKLMDGLKYLQNLEDIMLNLDDDHYNC